MSERPVPSLDDGVSETFWRATADERLLYQSCRECERSQFFPRSWCHYCGSDDVDWRESSGVGHVHTFTVIRRATELPWFESEVPYVVAYVELEEGFRICSNVVGCEPEAIECGTAVEVTFERVTDSIALPAFEPIEEPPIDE